MIKTISVIVPIFNVGKYLEKCIDSIIMQTYKELEIILIDDGATDDSGLICDRYEKIDGRIQVIHKKNGGLSDARNAGIEIASGEYIAFIDSDDYIDVNMFERLVSLLEFESADIAVCNYTLVYEGEDFSVTKILNKNKKYIVIDDKMKLVENCIKNNFDIFTVAWNKLYRTKCFGAIRYPVGKIHEDVFTTYKLLYNANKIVYVEDIYYYYLQRKSSIMGQKFNENRLYRLDALQEQLNFYLEKNEKQMWIETFFYYKFFLIQAIKLIEEDTEYSNVLIKPYKKYYDLQIKNIVMKMVIKKRDKFAYWLFYKMPVTYFWIYNRKNG